MAKTTRWTGGHASSDNWSEADNWDNGVPAVGDTLEFAGTTRLTPNNDIAADTSFAAITFISGAGAFTIGGNRITVAGDIRNNDDSLQTISLDMIFDATRTFIGGGDVAVTGVISGAGGLQKNDTGTLTLSGLNTYTGITNIVQGTLSINTIKNVSGGASSLGAPTTEANGTIAMGGFGAGLKYIGTGSTTDRVFNLDGGAGTAFSFEQSGTGNLLFTSAFTYANGAKTITLLGSTAGTGQISGVIADTGSGAVSLAKNGTGTWTLGINDVALTNTYSGGTTVASGILYGSALNNACFGTGTITLNGGNLYLERNAISNNIVNSNNSSILTLDNGFTSSISGTITNNNTLSLVLYNATHTLSGAISGVGNINVSALYSGKVTLSGNNIFTGLVTINSGTIYAGSTTAFGNNAPFSLANNATAILDTTGYNNSVGSITGGGGTGGNIVLGAATLTIGGDNTSPAAYSGVISGTGGIVKSGSGTLTLSSSNTYSGGTTANAGTINLTAASSLPADSNLTVNNGATVNTTGSVYVIINNTFGGTIMINAGGKVSANNSALNNHNIFTLVMNGGELAGGTAADPDYGHFKFWGNISATADSTISAIISRPTALTIDVSTSKILTISGKIQNATGEPVLAITKSSAGTLTLSGTNTYTGATTVSAGILLVTGSTHASSAVTVGNGGTLGGTGTINGTLTCNAGSALNPTISGINGGTLTYANATAISFAATTTLKIRAPSSTVDRITVSNATPTFTATNVALVVDTVGLATDITNQTIVSTAKTPSGIVGTFSSVTTTTGSIVIITYNTDNIVISITRAWRTCI
jgi:autotransporter-associated beta strand protein